MRTTDREIFQLVENATAGNLISVGINKPLIQGEEKRES
jgi:hypothetical protein